MKRILTTPKAFPERLEANLETPQANSMRLEANLETPQADYELTKMDILMADAVNRLVKRKNEWRETFVRVLEGSKNVLY